MLKELKLKKEHYTNLEKLLDDAGLVRIREAQPGRIFINKKDLDKMRKELTKAYTKRYPYLAIKKIKTAVALYMLNLSPAENNAVKDGYAIYLPWVQEKE